MTAGSPGRRGLGVATVLMTFETSCERQVAVVLVGAVRGLGAMSHVVPDDPDHGAENRNSADRPEDPLPELDEERDVRIPRQVVPLRVVAVREHGHDARAVDARRIVYRGLREAVVLELLDARAGELE